LCPFSKEIETNFSDSGLTNFSGQASVMCLVELLDPMELPERLNRTMKSAFHLLAFAFLTPFIFVLHAEPTGEMVAADRELWPTEVAANVALSLPLFLNGEKVGSVNAPAGRVYPVASISDEQVTIAIPGGEISLAIEKTDLLVRAAGLLKKKEERAAQAESRNEMAALAMAKAELELELSKEEQAPPASKTTFFSPFSEDLVQIAGRRTRPAKEDALEGKEYLVLYYSASWCGPCIKFTPELVRYYRTMKARHDNFELVFISKDHSEDKMVDYMSTARMPWPALDYNKRSNHPLDKFGGPGIPCLTVIDSEGKVVSHSYDGDEHLGPQKVMADLRELLKEE